MRRLMTIVSLLALLLTAWGAPPTWAQFPQPPIQPIIGPGAILDSNTASLAYYNSTAQYPLYSASIPAGRWATSPAFNATTLWTTTYPLHLRMRGTISTGAGNPALTVGINFGGSNATVALLNNALLWGNMNALPLQLDVWLNPIASYSATNVSGNNLTIHLAGRLRYQATGTIVNPGSGSTGTAGGGATQVEFNASVTGITRTGSPVTLNVFTNWSAASTSNTLSIYQRVLRLGN